MVSQAAAATCKYQAELLLTFPIVDDLEAASRIPFALPSPPFDSGTWEVVFEAEVISIAWKNIAPREAARILSLQATLGRPGAIYMLRNVLGPVWTPEALTGVASVPRWDASKRDFQLKFEVELKPWDPNAPPGDLIAPPASPTPTPTPMLQMAAQCILTPLPNDVELYFPRSHRSLWGNSTLLASTSPYFKTLLESGFAETKEVMRVDHADADVLAPLPFDESDGDDGPAAPAKHVPLSSFPHRRIKITQASFQTYHAVLFWIYTREITFAPSTTATADAFPLPASPKSVYRLAHLLELPELCKIALKAIHSQLTPSTIATELFNETSGTFDEVLDVLLEYAAAHRVEMRETKEWKDALATFIEVPWGPKVVGRLAAALV